MWCLFLIIHNVHKEVLYVCLIIHQNNLYTKKLCNISDVIDHQNHNQDYQTFQGKCTKNKSEFSRSESSDALNIICFQILTINKWALRIWEKNFTRHSKSSCINEPHRSTLLGCSTYKNCPWDNYLFR